MRPRLKLLTRAGKATFVHLQALICEIVSFVCLQAARSFDHCIVDAASAAQICRQKPILLALAVFLEQPIADPATDASFPTCFEHHVVEGISVRFSFS